MGRPHMRTLQAASVTPVEFYILLALADEDRHGYGIMRQVEIESEGTVRIGPGTLYTAIKRLLDLQYIREVESRLDPELDDARRKYYRLSASGRAAAAAEVERLGNLLKLARAKRVADSPVRGTRS
jgi:DNA-binding PadR family transcriptional regulator